MNWKNRPLQQSQIRRKIIASSKNFKGTFVQRFFVIVLSLIFGVLLFWLLGFLVSDIGSLRSPDFSKVKEKYVDAELVKKQKSLKGTLNDIRKNIKNQKQQREILKDSTDNLQNTINQLLSIQKQSIEKNLQFSAENQRTFTESQTLFLENQKQYQVLNKQISELISQQQQLEEELAYISQQTGKQEDLAKKEHNKIMARHRLKVAAMKLAVLLPVFLISALFFIKKRSGMYGPVIYAVFIAVFLKLSFVVHEYFPRKYFKYIAILVIIAIVINLLVYLLKRIISPKKVWLIKQYQEAYDKYVCPICSKPILIGPLRYVIGKNRRGLALAAQAMDTGKQQVYACPSCGTKLYEKCDKCGSIRHSLLPFCEHCGNQK
ncbi:MAG: hypothetical protein JXB29_09340 [Sedimentisphaerales bacterium]|nr:hypothetical protein [Sedimentisphaerales bacterium]